MKLSAAAGTQRTSTPNREEPVGASDIHQEYHQNASLVIAESKRGKDPWQSQDQMDGITEDG